MSRMKKMERRNFFMRVGAILIAICMIAALAIPAFAADTNSDATYSYTVRIFPGDKGTVDGGKSPIVKVVEPGYKWSGSDFDYGSRAASDTDKYYVRGLREAGRDNNTTNNLINPAFTVDHDIDLVVAYGVKGSDVEYTINYVEVGTEKQLREPQTYHGNVGDKPAVAYLYVEGYIPQYENITGTLDADSANNEWTFYYVKAEADEDDESDEVTTESTGSGSVTTQSTGSKKTSSKSSGAAASANSSSNGSGTSTGSSSASNGTTASGNATGTGTSNGSSLSVGEGTMLASNGAVNTRKNGPVEIVDVDEVETPLVEYEGDDESAVEENASEIINQETEGVVRASGMSGSAKIVLGLVVVMAVAAAGWVFFRRMNSGSEE